MVTLIAQLVSALALGTASLLAHGWLLASGTPAPLPIELWLSALPMLAVRGLLPSATGGLFLIALVLAAQYFVLFQAVGLLTRPRRHPARETAPRCSRTG